ncbi:hypothetical protein J7E78_08870 [Paenibacillus polymyxa]|uniref:hypothetical protein n=1 Tax=Paenibacillus polymyxa TaxID=1406 RepID=UPI001BE97E23|nr:hypothetical protein [Paenibacillus polymyxa]MBT2283645.1 hypothetical protein [Paenibacillus polymyxa]
MSKFFKFGVVRDEEVPEEINELVEETEKLPETIRQELSDAFKEEEDEDKNK